MPHNAAKPQRMLIGAEQRKWLTREIPDASPFRVGMQVPQGRHRRPLKDAIELGKNPGGLVGGGAMYRSSSNGYGYRTTEKQYSRGTP